MSSRASADRPAGVAGLVETVRSILKGKPGYLWHVEPETSVFDALALMADKGVGALLVIEHGRLAGIVSERDYARKVILKGRSSKDTAVREIMTSPVVTVTPEKSVDHCMRLVTEHRIRHLPVLEEGRVIGIVSIGDLVKAIISAQVETIDELNRYIRGAYTA